MNQAMNTDKDGIYNVCQVPIEVEVLCRKKSSHDGSTSKTWYL